MTRCHRRSDKKWDHFGWLYHLFDRNFSHSHCKCKASFFSSKNLRCFVQGRVQSRPVQGFSSPNIEGFWLTRQRKVVTDCIPDSNILCTINCCKKFTAKKILPIHRKGQYSWKGFHGKISLQRRSFLPEAGWLFIISRIRYSRICGHKKCSKSPGFLSLPNKESSAKTFCYFFTVKIPIQKYLAFRWMGLFWQYTANNNL